MLLATWNVNSIRARIDRVIAWMEKTAPDVLAIQETKCKDSQFPFERFEELGYEVAHLGLNQWNGVAIASRIGLDEVEEHFPSQPGFAKDPAATQDREARALSALCGDVRVWSLYVPNGRVPGDPHYRYKLAWLEALRADAQDWLTADPQAAIALVGDWNVAPLDMDVWDMAEFADKTHVTEPERAAFNAFADIGFTEVTRPHTPGPGVYTFWDYQGLSFPKRKGMRIDFQLHSPALAARVTGAEIDREERKGAGASDHAPVVVTLD